MGPVRLGELGEGLLFRTRLTGRNGMVMGFAVRREEPEVLVEWTDSQQLRYLHPGVLVDPTPSVLVRRAAS